MLHPTPHTARLTDSGAGSPSWSEVGARMEDAQFYWLATVRPDGRPHVAPVLGIWLDDALHIAASPASRKARNLANSPHATVSVDSDDLHLVVEAAVTKVQDHTSLRLVAEEYLVKYGWQVIIKDGAYHGDGAPTAGPPPYELYRLTPQTVFAFGTDDAYTPTRWRFSSP